MAEQQYLRGDNPFPKKMRHRDCEVTTETFHSAGGDMLAASSTTSASAEQRDTDPETPNTSGIEIIEHTPPDGGYGWVCTICSFIINACTCGVNSAWGVFLDWYTVYNTFSHATEFEYAMIGGLAVSQALLISPICVALQDKVGSRVTMLLGAAIQFAGLTASSNATTIWHLFVSYSLCFGWGQGLLYIPVCSLKIFPPGHRH